MKIVTALFVGFMFVNPVMAKSIAVTDLAYSETIQDYVHTVDYHNTNKLSGSASNENHYFDDYENSSSSKNKFNASGKTDFHEYEHNFSYIEYGELHKFTGDIKGELIKSGEFKVVQAKTAPMKKNESVYDIIKRIKKGDFPHADYVLFGRVSELSFNDGTYQVDGNMMNSTLNLTLTAEFSLINTKNYEIIASFSATGDGQDTKILSVGTQATPNRAAVVSQVSKNLSVDVFRQLEQQVFEHYSNETMGNSNFDTRQNNGIEPPPQKTQGVVVFE